MLSKFDKYVADGLISRKVSPCGRLVLFDYTEKCQYEKAWDEVTLNARGTVYELATGAVVARAFPKFFNFSELSPERQSQLLGQKFTVHEKMDGSLGIVYFYDGEWRVNTRGSFESDQAKKGLELLQNFTQALNEDVTYLVEIIYPENRIVVDYKGESKLSFLSAYDTESGVELDYHPFNYEAKSYLFSNISEIQQNLGQLSFNEEGYVVTFADGTRAKFKGDEYVRMHRIISGMSPLVLWESIKNGKVCEKLMASIPEEFRSPYEEMAEALEQKYLTEHNQISNHLFKILETFGVTKKQLGLYMKENTHELNVYIFPRVVGNTGTLDDMIKKAIKPKGNVL